jgi:nanoRNase/pAp phosphatase (c-di-AMP/oligoRNAs hydrolase)
VEYFLTIGHALANTRIFDKAIVADLQEVVFPEVVAEMADFLLRLENIETVLCIGHYSTELVLSIRTERHDLNAGEIIKKVVLGFGKAGGHGMMAGGKIDDVGDSSEELQQVVAVLKSRFLSELGIETTMTGRLIH